MTELKYPNKYGALGDALFILRKEDLFLRKRMYIKDKKHYDVYIAYDGKGIIQDANIALELIKAAKITLENKAIIKKCIWVKK